MRGSLVSAGDAGHTISPDHHTAHVRVQHDSIC